ncbi:MAG TPA: carbon monoxide dehydrogenase subunit G [Pseudolabrys sp.]|nr:carbon monoxide dehydrogenase subunit G [Pseudolabrys sp.]
MPMTMTGAVELKAPRERVWNELNNPERLKGCIPGCEELEALGNHKYRAKAKMKVGPVSARFSGRITISDQNPPYGYRISGEGEGGVAGFAKGHAVVRLDEGEGVTTLTYDVEAQVGGKIAQLGQRLLNGAAKKLADDFFVKFADLVAKNSEG